MTEQSRKPMTWTKPQKVWATTTDAGERRLSMSWASGEVEVEASLCSTAGALAVTDFTVRTKGSRIPRDFRTLPSDGKIISLLHDMGTRGDFALAWTAKAERLGDHTTVDVVNAVLAGTVTPGEDFSFDAVRMALVEKLDASQRKRAQIEQVKAMINEGLAAQEIVDRLMAEGLSQSTAFRRLRLAKADMDLNQQDGQTTVLFFQRKPEAES